MTFYQGDSNTMNFDQLMAQATQVAKQQDASLMERARQKRREDDLKRHRLEREQRERDEAQALLDKKRDLQDRKQKLLMDQKKLDKRKTIPVVKGRSPSGSKPNPKRVPIASFLPEKKASNKELIEARG